MLDRYIGEHMVSIYNINTGTYQLVSKFKYHSNIDAGRYCKMREALYTQGIIWINIILNHIDTKRKNSWTLYRPE